MVKNISNESINYLSQFLIQVYFWGLSRKRRNVNKYIQFRTNMEITHFKANKPSQNFISPHYASLKRKALVDSLLIKNLCISSLSLDAAGPA